MHANRPTCIRTGRDRREAMKALLSAIAVAAALVTTSASAQGIDMTGQYRCVQVCTEGLAGQTAFITQGNGAEMNLVNEAGQPARGWFDRYGHFWVERWNEGAVVSPDGMTIQFDRGTVWQR